MLRTPRTWLLLAIAACLGGCAAQLRWDTAQATRCPAEAIEIGDVQFDFPGTSWTALCGNDLFYCRSSLGGLNDGKNIFCSQHGQVAQTGPERYQRAQERRRLELERLLQQPAAPPASRPTGD